MRILHQLDPTSTQLLSVLAGSIPDGFAAGFSDVKDLYIYIYNSYINQNGVKEKREYLKMSLVL